VLRRPVDQLQQNLQAIVAAQILVKFALGLFSFGKIRESAHGLSTRKHTKSSEPVPANSSRALFVTTTGFEESGRPFSAKPLTSRATMESLEEIKTRIEGAIPGAKIEIIPNPGPANQPSLFIDHKHALEIARFLRDDPALRLDLCSNVTGVDWLDRTVKKKVKVKKLVEGEEKEVDEMQEEFFPGYIEAVYHLFSIALKQGPVVVRLRTLDRVRFAPLPSLTPVWRSAEFQEREIYDLYGIHFDGHPDLRRILMWDEFEDFPMRKDYAEPDDYEYEPTPHDDVLAKAKSHYPPRPKTEPLAPK
jgi:NADH-quinone oxidoreductase subunit C